MTNGEICIAGERYTFSEIEEAKIEYRKKALPSRQGDSGWILEYGDPVERVHFDVLARIIHEKRQSNLI